MCVQTPTRWRKDLKGANLELVIGRNLIPHRRSADRFIYRPDPYSTVNAFHVGCKNQPLYAVSGTSRGLFWDKYKTHKYSVGRAYNCWMLNWWCITWPVGFKRLSKGRFTHSMPRPCRAAKVLECVFLIWFTQCGRVWFTFAMPRPCHALTMPFFLNQMGKTHSKPLSARHGRGTARARHAMCESAFRMHL
jgi:hypothetical protein